MIVVISQEEDYSTSETLQWLIFFKTPFIRINRGDRISLSQVMLTTTGRPSYVLSTSRYGAIDLDSIKAVWYRRGEVHFSLPNFSFISDESLKQSIIRHLLDEKGVLEEYLQYLLSKIPHIGTYEKRGINKLLALSEAKKLGIDIPNTMITAQKRHLDGFGPKITKSIFEVFTPTLVSGRFITYTEVVEDAELCANFFPSLFQNFIEKEADIRVFILFDKVYSMSIQSQQNEQTSVDFRKYSKEKPSRSFPFKLPLEIEQKLVQLMKNIGLETASVDMIFTKDGRFVFLEANPIGQFSMTSKPCNYYLEREIAKALINIQK